MNVRKMGNENWKRGENQARPRFHQNVSLHLHKKILTCRVNHDEMTRLPLDAFLSIHQSAGKAEQ